MGRKQYTPRVIFNGEGNADKCIVGYKDDRMPNGMTISCLQLSDEIKHDMLDSNIQLDKEVIGEYFHMFFRKRKTLQALIAHLQDIENCWDEIVGEGDTDGS